MADDEDDSEVEEEEEDDDDEPVSEDVKKLPKGPPRRARTAYAYFVQQNFAATAKEVGRDPRKVLKRLAKIWSEYSEEDKEEYQEMHEEDRERYEKEKKAWTKAYGGRPPKMRRKRRFKDAPKRTRNAFIMYEKAVWNKVSAEFPEMTQREIIREIAKRWRAMTPAEKKPYQDQAAQDKVRYAHEKEEYMKTFYGTGLQNRLKRKERERKAPQQEHQVPLPVIPAQPDAPAAAPEAVPDPVPAADDQAPAPDPALLEAIGAQVIEAVALDAEGVAAQPPAPANPAPEENVMAAAAEEFM